MTIPDWLGYKVAKAILLLNPLTHVAGFAISVWAWHKTRKTGYIIFALYFLLMVLGKGFPSVLRVVNGPPQTQLPTPQLAQSTRGR